MKKKMIALLAGLMLTLSAGSAFAYFGTVSGNNLDLVRVVYDTAGSVEVATDLGSVDGSGLASASAFSLSQFGTGKTFANLNVAYFAFDTTTHSLWTTSTQLPAGFTTGTVGSAISASGLMSGYYNSLGGSTGTVVASQSNVNSFFSQFDLGGAATGSADAVLNPATNELNLAALATAGYADLQLYKFTITGSGRNTAVSVASDLVLRTNADGTTSVQATPIPAAAWLFGSGLMGLFGLRRKARG